MRSLTRYIPIATHIGRNLTTAVSSVRFPQVRNEEKKSGYVHSFPPLSFTPFAVRHVHHFSVGKLSKDFTDPLPHSDKANTFRKNMREWLTVYGNNIPAAAAQTQEERDLYARCWALNNLNKDLAPSEQQPVLDIEEKPSLLKASIGSMDILTLRIMIEEFKIPVEPFHLQYTQSLIDSHKKIISDLKDLSSVLSDEQMKDAFLGSAEHHTSMLNKNIPVFMEIHRYLTDRLLEQVARGYTAHPPSSRGSHT